MIDRMINIKKSRKRILNLIIQKSCLGEMMEIMESIFLYTSFQISEFVFYYINRAQHTREFVPFVQ